MTARMLSKLRYLPEQRCATEIRLLLLFNAAKSCEAVFEKLGEPQKTPLFQSTAKSETSKLCSMQNSSLGNAEPDCQSRSEHQPKGPVATPRSQLRMAP
ncbi:predicted protein [Chaetomium globosum CBS 148.51]|uniref:Uncharacterized protein n=1 Tax=Chaetomium globosum (strain ATCC 6205 / CBS 148.51 / DSM 1962 / NBRC 6347 / NRRL 1970) TaxID=306901 RepID=Q2H8A9_CHAGB|nr:uncharacterized protein CHGG_03545 [Chaetomium globosum CBS 148.51]EAQ91610.1 predicted protein [Chaetomium globosum CBS 148.51]